MLVLSALVGSIFGSVLKAATGGAYDLSTGQYSSVINEHVFNSAPIASHVGYGLGYGAPVDYAIPFGYGASHLSAHSAQFSLA